MVSKPLGIIQARLESSRIERKMLQDVGGHPLLWWSWDAAVKALGRPNVIIASPRKDVAALHLALPDALFFRWDGDENDVLGRLYSCALQHRDRQECVIYRITPEDWPPVLYGDRFTLADLRVLDTCVSDPYLREHVGYLRGPRKSPGIDLPRDLERARRDLSVEPNQR